jgi:hypothetical protein
MSLRTPLYQDCCFGCAVRALGLGWASRPTCDINRNIIIVFIVIMIIMLIIEYVFFLCRSFGKFFGLLRPLRSLL